MFSRLPEFLDPWRAAEQAALYQGEAAVADLSRLGELLSDTAGTVTYRLEFLRDDNGQAVLRGSVRATLRMVCQRCLEPMEVPVAGSWSQAAVSGLDEANRLSEEYDPLLVEGRLVRPLELIEEELLLLLPQIAVHEAGRCSAPANGGSGPNGLRNSGEGRTQDSPFAELAKLKKHSPH
jgi:uncharacterized protein